MRYRRLGKTGLQVSEIGFGGEWLERHPEAEGIELIHHAAAQGINILDCWMADPTSRDIIGKGIRDNRSHWYIQGHIGSTWKDGQYFRSRDIQYVRPAFEDLLQRLQTDYIDLGMIHYVDSEQDWAQIQHSDYLDYIMGLKKAGVIRHIGISSHNPKVAKLAAESGYVEMILFSINPAFDMLPASEDSDTLFAEEFSAELKGIDPEHAALYSICEQHDVGITVMKPFAGGRLFDAKRSPFGVSLTPVQCIHYALTRPAVSSVLCGYDTKEQVDQAVAYENASREEKDFASVIANAPLHAYRGQCTYCGHCKPCAAELDISPPCSRRSPPPCARTTRRWSTPPRPASAAAPVSPAARSACPLRSGWKRPQPCSAAEVPSETANHAGRLSACVIFISIFYFSSGFFSEQSSAAACSRSEDSRNTSCTPSSACFRRS